jgi:5S rRNA maturation endonuclease (ribonuclease M5)
MFRYFLSNQSTRYIVDYTAIAGESNELEVQGENCWLVSDRDLSGNEIAEELAFHLEEQEGVPVRRVILHRVGKVAVG